MKRITFNTFEKAYWLIGVSVTLILGIAFHASLISIFYSLFAVTNAVLMTKARIEGYILQLCGNVLYLLISWRQHYYGEMITAGVVIIISLVGMINWFKRCSADNTVRINRVAKREITLMITSQILFFPAYYFLIRAIHGDMPLFSAMSLACTVLATYFMSRVSAINYLFFILKDFAAIALWSTPLVKGDTSVIPVLIPNVLYVINDIYGYYNWKRMYEALKKHS